MHLRIVRFLKHLGDVATVLLDLVCLSLFCFFMSFQTDWSTKWRYKGTGGGGGGWIGLGDGFGPPRLWGGQYGKNIVSRFFFVFFEISRFTILSRFFII